MAICQMADSRFRYPSVTPIITDETESDLQTAYRQKFAAIQNKKIFCSVITHFSKCHCVDIGIVLGCLRGIKVSIKILKKINMKI